MEGRYITSVPLHVRINAVDAKKHGHEVGVAECRRDMQTSGALERPVALSTSPAVPRTYLHNSVLAHGYVYVHLVRGQ